LRREEASVSAAVRAAADRREGLARLRGEVGALKSKVEAAQSEVDRLESSREEALNRARAAQSEFALFESQVAGMDQGEQSLDAEYETANSKLIEASARVDQLRDEERRADRDRAAHDARLEALRMGSASKDGSSVLLQSQLRGMLGS
jgi:chromosome segregation protein